MIRPLLPLLLIAGSAFGQQAGTESPELRALREKYRGLLADAESSAGEQRRLSLVELERRRTEAGNYEAARRVRELLRQDDTRVAATAETRKPVVLKATGGSISGSVDTQPEGVRMKGAGAALEWSLPSITPGKYRVVVRAAVASGRSDDDEDSGSSSSGGPLEDAAAVVKAKARMKEAAAERSTTGKPAGGVCLFELVSSIDKSPPLYYRITPTGSGWETLKEFPLGVVDVKGTIATFRMKAEAADTGGLLQLADIQLIPHTATAEVASEDEFEAYRSKYVTAEKERLKPVDRDWLLRLARLEASARNDPAALAKVREERVRLQGGQGGGPRVLPANDSLLCKTRGEMRLTNSREYLTRLRPGGQITWDLPRCGITPGEWEVTVTAMVGPDHGGEYAIVCGSTEMELKLASPSPPEDRKRPKPAADGNTASAPEPVKPEIKELAAGVLNIEAGQKEIALKVVRLVHPEGGLFDLKSITLKPVSKKSTSADR